MPVQVQQSTLAQRLGGRIAAANAEHKDKPLDLGFKRLPPGIRDGVGKLHIVQMKQYGQDEKIVALRGQEYLHVVGVVRHPKEFKGETIEGHQMFQRFPLCDIPANPNNKDSKPRSFSDNWYEFQQFFMRFGINPPNETPQSDPNGTKTWAYYQGAIQVLNQKIAQGGDNAPHYEFTTRGWTPPATPQKPKPDEMVFEEWGKQCEWSEKFNPADGVKELPPGSNPPVTNNQPEPFTEPPTGKVVVSNYPVNNQTFTQTGLADNSAEIESLVMIAMNDPEGATTEGEEASAKLEELAWANGWTRAQTAEAADWSAVGDMCLNKPPAQGAPVTIPPSAEQQPTWTGNISPGAKFKFAKRTKDGEKLKNNKGETFPPQDVEVATVNSTNKTCTVKTKDGKDVVDIRTKKPIDVKFEWLE